MKPENTDLKRLKKKQHDESYIVRFVPAYILRCKLVNMVERMVSRIALTPARIVDAALAMVDKGGLRALTMRALGARLGVEAMSLYHHVRNRDELLDLLVERILSEAAADDLPASGDWQAWLRRVATRYREILRAHPALAPEIAVRPARSPAAWRQLEAGAAILREVGFSPARSFYILNTLGMFVMGHVLAETGGTLEPASETPRTGTHDEIFAFGLSAFLSGCAMMLAERPDHRQEPHACPT